MKKDRPRIKYFGTGFVPIYFGFTTNPKAFAGEMSRLKVAEPPLFVSAKAFATTHCLTSKNKSFWTVIVCLDMKKCRTATAACVPAVLAHEATHVWQYAKEKIGEEKPGSEVEAYAIQYFTECMLKELE